MIRESGAEHGVLYGIRFMTRIRAVTQAQFTAAQRRLFDAITQGKRGENRPIEAFLTPEGGLRGPFNPFLYSPELGDPAQQLGAAVRYKTSNPPRSRELAILCVAAEWKAEYEWCAHARIARKEGLPDSIIESIRWGKQPVFSDPTEAAVYGFVRELSATKSVSESLYTEAVRVLGESGVVELVMLVGYYVFISMVLNVFEIPLPPGETPPFEDAST